jgi:hypothetical protein
MTLQRPDSRLPGWDGPVFPRLTSNLVAALEALPERRRTRANLEDQLERVQGLVSIAAMGATDGYHWPTVVSVAVHGGIVAVALPNANLDRSPAVYMQGQHMNDATADAVMARVIRALRPSPGQRPILTGP